MLELSVHCLSGKTADLTVSSTASPQEVSAAIEQLLGIPSRSQQWLVESNPVSFQEAPTVTAAGLQSGDKVTIVHGGFTPLVELPGAFSFELKTVRERQCSSAFRMLHKISASISENWLHYEPWRKNDHDKFLFDMHANKCTMQTSHWMAGSHTHVAEITENPLKAFRNGWNLPAKRASQEYCFWRGPEYAQDQEDTTFILENTQDQERPNYNAVIGWFVLPSENCNEIEVDIPVPNGSQRIIRMLIDQDGMPIRAAVKGCSVGHMHQDIEEYEATLKPDESVAKPDLKVD